ncbi:hypothetical protein PHPALM_28007 [Phytophthora palmivora]|uniref:Uncharacterized protein n=1 Tax=Phytophthora palmivora TaxID=4796 RepID=A0A2P4XB63_9STRA|nr:hypothetical protein PHPALM_28007 [Phytophthora palmivora]
MGNRKIVAVAASSRKSRRVTQELSGRTNSEEAICVHTEFEKRGLDIKDLTQLGSPLLLYPTRGVGQADEDQRDAAAGVGLSRAKHGGSAREGGRDRGRGQDGSDDFVDEVELDGVDVVEVVLVGVVEDMAAGVQTATPATPSALLHPMCIDQFVAFSPAKELWMKKKAYRSVGTQYIAGRVCRRAKNDKDKLQIQWLDTRFQSYVDNLSVGLYKRNQQLQRSFQLDDDDDLQEIKVFDTYEPAELLPTTLAEVEAVENMRFEPSGPPKP